MAKAKENFPYNLEAEQTVLGCIIIDADLQLDILLDLKRDDFYVETHKIIFDAMQEIANDTKPIDNITLVDIMEKRGTLEKVGGISYLTNLIRGVPSSSNYKYYLDIVKRDSILRKLIKVGSDILSDAATSNDGFSSLEKAENGVYGISEENETSSLVNLAPSYSPVLETFAKIGEDKNYLQGLMTGFVKLDSLTNGFKGGQLIILAARPAVGKTTLAMNMVTNIAEKHNVCCAVFSLEMTKNELAQRMLCSKGSVSMDKALKGRLSEEDWNKLYGAQKKLNDLNIFVDDTAMTNVPKILSKCRRLKARYNLGLIVIDHIQLMRAVKESDSRQQEVSEISRSLKMLAKELNVPVIALSQLSRGITGRKGGKPMLSDLRESGAIEQDADIVMFIHRPDLTADEKELMSGKVEKNVAEIIVEKNRSGSTGTAKLLFRGEWTKFINPPPEYLSDGDAPREWKKRESAEQSYNNEGESAPVSNEPPVVDDSPIPDEPPAEEDVLPF